MRRIGEAGRQIKTRHLEVIQGKWPGRWLHRGQTTREISRGLRINDREAVERAVQEALAPKPRPFVVRRAA